MLKLNEIAQLHPEVQDSHLYEMMRRAGRYVVYNDATEKKPAEMRGFTCLTAAEMYREIDRRLRPDILDRETNDIL